MLQVHTRMRAVRSRACPNYVPAERRTGLRATQLALRHQHERTRRLACFADSLRVARPVQLAAAASGRARRPPRPRPLCTTATSTPAPPLAAGPPHTASRTTPAHTHPCSTHLHLHRTHDALTSPPATRSPHPIHRARAPADTFLVPARSPRKTRPSRRPPRSARPLVRPTSFMRTTTPRSPPAKALRAMSRLRCAQSLHCTNAGKRPPAACRSSLPRGRVWPPRHDRLCLPTLLRVACPRHAAMLSV